MYLEILAAAFQTTQSSLIVGLIAKLWQEKENEIIKNVPREILEGKMRKYIIEATTEERNKGKPRFGNRFGTPLKSSLLLNDDNDPLDIDEE